MYGENTGLPKSEGCAKTDYTILTHSSYSVYDPVLSGDCGFRFCHDTGRGIPGGVLPFIRGRASEQHLRDADLPFEHSPCGPSWIGNGRNGRRVHVYPRQLPAVLGISGYVGCNKSTVPETEAE